MPVVVRREVREAAERVELSLGALASWAIANWERRAALTTAFDGEVVEGDWLVARLREVKEQLEGR